MSKKKGVKKVRRCHIELVEIFSTTDNQYRFRQAQPDKSSYERLLDTLFFIARELNFPKPCILKTKKLHFQIQLNLI